MTTELYHHQGRGIPYLSVGSLAYPGFVKLIGYFYRAAFLWEDSTTIKTHV